MDCTHKSTTAEALAYGYRPHSVHLGLALFELVTYSGTRSNIRLSNSVTGGMPRVANINEYSAP